MQPVIDDEKKKKQCRRRHPRISVQVLDSNWRAGQSESVCETLVPALGRTCSDVPEGGGADTQAGRCITNHSLPCFFFFYFLCKDRFFFFFKKNSPRTVLLMDHDFHSSRVIFFLSLWRDRERGTTVQDALHSRSCVTKKLQIITPPPSHSVSATPCNDIVRTGRPQWRIIPGDRRGFSIMTVDPYRISFR